jgi:hypothetical protein
MVSFQKEPLAKKKICERPSLTGEDSNTSQQRQLMTHLSKESGYDGYLEHVRWSNAEICSLYIYTESGIQHSVDSNVTKICRSD